MVQGCRLAPAGEEKLAASVPVAVERGHASADKILEVTCVSVSDDARLLDVVRGRECGQSGRSGWSGWSGWSVDLGDRHGDRHCHRDAP